MFLFLGVRVFMIIRARTCDTMGWPNHLEIAAGDICAAARLNCRCTDPLHQISLFQFLYSFSYLSLSVFVFACVLVCVSVCQKNQYRAVIAKEKWLQLKGCGLAGLINACVISVFNIILHLTIVTQNINDFLPKQLQSINEGRQQP